MRFDPEIRSALPILIIVGCGFLAGLTLLVVAVLSGP
jgi:hypothetical protein